MRKSTIAATLAVAATFSGAAVTVAAEATRGWLIGTNAERVKVYGCAAEDDCQIDYRGAQNGAGVWVIRRVDH